MSRRLKQDRRTAGVRIVRGRLAAAFLLLLPGAGWAEEIDGCGRAAGTGWRPREFDARTGGDVLNYPRDPRVLYQHLRLELEFDELAARRVRGAARYTLRAVAPGVRSVELDAVDFFSVVVTVNGARVEPVYDHRRIVIPFAADVPVDAPTTVEIRYRIEDPDSGLIFAPADPAYPNRPPGAHTQGQTETNRYWFPAHDSPNVRFPTEIVVTVPRPLTALSNGRLVSRQETSDGGRTTFHWRQEVPHVAYLASLAIGEFDVQRDEHRGIPVEYYVPRPWAKDSRRTFERTPRMIGLFETLTGVPYPYAKYAQAVVPNFESGGMENISATTLTETCLIDERAAIDTDSDGLIAHELAHQWYGDLLTCRTWAHIWLNEGFASFMDEVWIEHARGRDWYQTAFRETYRRVAEADRPDAPGALVHRDYQQEWEPFGHKGRLAYSKGSSVLAMLRHLLGEKVFWKGMAAYTTRFAGRLVETEDFRRAMEEASGRSLEQFFEQYCYRPGTPTLRVSYRWNAEEKTAELEFRQTQHISARNPAFSVPIDVYFQTDAGGVTEVFEMTQRSGQFRRAFDREPAFVCLDPQAGLLAKLEFDLPRARWIAVLEKGPTAVSRLDAARALGEDPRPEAVAALAACLARDDEFWRVRAEAAASLGKARCDAARDALLAALTKGPGVDEPRVRRAAVSALGNYRGDARAIETLVRFARSDESYNVEAAATRALGAARARSAADVLVENLSRPSRNDQLLLAALDALNELEDVRAVAAAMKAAAYGSPFRTRPAAIRHLGRMRWLPEERRKEVREFLVGLLDDPQPPALRSAVAALGSLGDEQSIDPLQARAEQGRGRGRATREALAREIEEAVSAIRSRSKEPEAVRSLRREVEKLRKDVDDLRRRAEKGGAKPAAATQPAGG